MDLRSLLPGVECMGKHGNMQQNSVFEKCQVVQCKQGQKNQSSGR